MNVKLFFEEETATEVITMFKDKLAELTDSQLKISTNFQTNHERLQS